MANRVTFTGDDQKLIERFRKVTVGDGTI